MDLNRNEFLMSIEKQHEWATFYSPRNGRIRIEACRHCGVAKSILAGSLVCTPVSEEKKNTRLRGWATRRDRVSNFERSSVG